MAEAAAAAAVTALATLARKVNLMVKVRKGGYRHRKMLLFLLIDLTLHGR